MIGNLYWRIWRTSEPLEPLEPSEPFLTCKKGNKKDEAFYPDFIFLVRAKGLEPLCTRRRILNPVRLPIPPRSHDFIYYKGYGLFGQWDFLGLGIRGWGLVARPWEIRNGGEMHHLLYSIANF